MPAPDLESFKVALEELSSSTKFNNLIQALEDEFSTPIRSAAIRLT